VRIRFRFSKLGKVRFTSQRDVARMWERALRRAELPLAYTEGFSPRPQLSFGLALPTGCESLAEYVDVVLDDARPETADVDIDDLPRQLTGLLPDGLEVDHAVAVERRATSLQQEVTSCSWTMAFRGLSRPELEARVDALLAAPTVTITRERKGRQEQDDLRPSVVSLAVIDGDGRSDDVVELAAELITQPRGVRPVELVRGLIAVAPGGDDDDGSGSEGTPTEGIPVLDRACRTQQWIERDGDRREPVEPQVTRSPAGAVRALERAS
jgi:radical SAM-linked protein